MKTMLALLLVAASACGTNSSSATRPAQIAECSVALAAGATAADVKQVLDDVEAGLLDPCTGQAPDASKVPDVDFLRIDWDEASARWDVIFRLNGYRLNKP